MIEHPTVFILGAGAHCAYGLPSGEDLKKQCVQTVLDAFRLPDTNFLNLADRKLVTPEEVNPFQCSNFAAALNMAGQPSIDAFLDANRHKEGFTAIGKGAIAQVLLRYELQRTQAEDDWLSYLFEEMLRGANSPELFIAKNKIGFITFNYDRFLESWLLEKIKYSFGRDEAEALRYLRMIPIHHVYGMLGSFPDDLPKNNRRWIEASENIRTIYDIQEDHQTLYKSLEILDEADRICLLGFGFHEENMKILDLPNKVKACKDRGGRIFASRYNITHAEFARLTQKFTWGVIETSPEEHIKCKQTLRELSVF